VKFVTTSANGNNLYLDNINLMQKAPVNVAQENIAYTMLNLYPNPTTGASFVDLYSSSQSEVRVLVINVIGQVVMDKSAKVVAGKNTINLSVDELPAGIYNVSVGSEENTTVKTLSIIK